MSHSTTSQRIRNAGAAVFMCCMLGAFVIVGIVLVDEYAPSSAIRRWCTAAGFWLGTPVRAVLTQLDWQVNSLFVGYLIAAVYGCILGLIPGLPLAIITYFIKPGETQA